jgi:hypothetical protein
MRKRRQQTATPRRGVILLVVLALLTLFAIVGITFVMYSNSEANASRIYREAQAPTQADMDPELLLSMFLGQLIYDVDDTNGQYSALRGHSLARSMYGYQSGGTNQTPFNGTGRVRSQTLPAGFAGNKVGPAMENLDDYHLINYMVFRDNTGAAVDGGMIHDPERPGWRAATGAANPYAGGFNVPYTYPDLNNVFLAAVKADGTVLMPSFHRPWLFNNGKTFDDQTNTNWTSAYGKYLTLRPRPNDMGTGFPFPEDAGGDVKNLAGTPGYFDPVSGNYVNNDSPWIDIGAPIMVAPDGTKFKALFAPLILDLDGRLNLNVHGNIRGQDATARPISTLPAGAGQFHRSNQGWGPWEVSLEYALNQQNSGSYEWPKLFLSDLSGNAPYLGRYGQDQFPTASGSVAPSGTMPHFYSWVDYDAANEQSSYAATAVWQLPQAGSLSCFPVFPAQGYGNGSSTERTNHPLEYNFFTPGGDDRTFPIAHMEALLRYGDVNSPALTSDLFRLLSANFSAGPRQRNMVTTHSFDWDRPGVTPWIWDPAATAYTYGMVATTYTVAPSAPAIPFPNDSTFQPSAQAFGTAPSPTSPNTSEFSKPGATTPPADWRALSAALGRIDLNRNLTAYAQPGDPNFATTYAQATSDRQNLAKDIFNRFVAVTGVDLTAGAGTPQYAAARWLAQLAVNIVDFVDTDDYMTPFYWNPSNTAEVVFGTELPRVVLNEVYAAYVNDPGDTGTTPTKFDINVWVELQNTFSPDVNPPDPNMGAAPLSNAANATGTSGVYQLMITKQDANLKAPANVLGDPSPALIYTNSGGAQCIVTDFTASATTKSIQPFPAGNNRYAGTSGGNVGLYMIGPPTASTPFPSTGTPNPAVPQVTLGDAHMTYVFPLPMTNQTAPPPPTILLRRLACPDLPANPATFGGTTSTTTPYNPYITVDYVDLTNVGPVADLATNDLNGNPGPGPANAPNTQSYGKTQPYESNATIPMGANQLIKPQAPTMGAMKQPLAGQPQHTFFYQNVDASISTAATGPTVGATPPANYPAFNWLVQQDRQVISPMEMLHVSAYKPHELTQQFAALPALTVSTTAVTSTSMATTITPVAMSGYIDNVGFWSIAANAKLLVDPGPNQEVITVASIDMTNNPPQNFSASFTKTHTAGFAILSTTPALYSHRAPWFDQTARIYRALEFLETANRAAGVSVGGRTPGKININTIWDGEIFQGLCDASASNNFNNVFTATNGMPIYDPNPSNPSLFKSFLTSRTPGSAPAQTDAPFWSLAAPYVATTGSTQYPYGLGIENTFLRSFPNPGNANPPRRLFEVPQVNMNTLVGGLSTGEHPYQALELMTKIYNNTTTRSNVFGVWVTVGFFKVVDDTVRPVKLGAEIGRAENRHTRHRMFAIVDRSNITIAQNTTANVNKPGPAPLFFNATAAAQSGMTGTFTVGTAYDGRPLGIQNGDQLVFDPGPNQEVLAVNYSSTNGTITTTANFANNHAQGFVITNVGGSTTSNGNTVNILLGNPGPASTWADGSNPAPRFDARTYPMVVRYFNFIK